MEIEIMKHVIIKYPELNNQNIRFTFEAGENNVFFRFKVYDYY